MVLNMSEPLDGLIREIGDAAALCRDLVQEVRVSEPTRLLPLFHITLILNSGRTVMVFDDNGELFGILGFPAERNWEGVRAPLIPPASATVEQIRQWLVALESQFPTRRTQRWFQRKRGGD